MRPLTRRATLLGLAASGAAVVACAPGDDAESTASGGSSGETGSAAAPDPARADEHRVAIDAGLATTVLPVGASGLELSQVLLAEATAVVVVGGVSPGDGASAAPSSAPPGDPAVAAATALALGVPLLEAGDGLGAELDRLGVRVVVAYPSAGLDVGERELIDGPAGGGVPTVEGLPITPSPANAVALALPGGEPSPSAGATLAAAGVAVTEVEHSDPRATAATVAAVRAVTGPVLGIGEFGDSGRFAARVEAARTLDELPGGGVAPFPGRMMVALYGHPGSSVLGVLGEQGPERSAARVAALAEEYEPHSAVPVIGAFEIITTIASASAGSDGDYSSESSPERILPYIEAAEAAGLYTVLDLQPGRTDFLTQAKLYENLLRRPTVGLALDPEWRLQPGKRHMVSIGQVHIDEVNAVGSWLADLVADAGLPPKVVILHQFQQRMIVDRERLDTSRDELQFVMHADGFGTPALKQATWARLKEDLPDGIWLGWKNFIDEDQPMLTPQQTMGQVDPAPNFVSYQ